jgi:hypothetical protein
MADLAISPTSPKHLYIVAGYPASGKSYCLRTSSREKLPLFGPGSASVLPDLDAIPNVHELSDTATKVNAGFWCTLRDLPHLNKEPRYPNQLILHLDLILAFLVHRRSNRVVPDTVEIEAAFDRLFARPALQSYDRQMVTTLRSPLEEIQHRWRQRYPSGIPANSSARLVEKDKLIMSCDMAAPVFAATHEAWERCLESLSRKGTLTGVLEAELY